MTSDYFSNYCELDLLRETTLTSVVKKLRAHFNGALSQSKRLLTIRLCRFSRKHVISVLSIAGYFVTLAVLVFFEILISNCSTLIIFFSSVGDIMSKYRSGKIPKAFKIIPSLQNWEEVQ